MRELNDTKSALGGQHDEEISFEGGEGARVLAEPSASQRPLRGA